MSRLTEKNKHVCNLCGQRSRCIRNDCQLVRLYDKMKHYEDLEEQGGLIELPCKVGDELYRIVYPYRQLPKVAKYRVKNFRTVKRGQKLQMEVQADSSPIKSWMYFDAFYTSKAKAEAKLAELKEGGE